MFMSGQRWSYTLPGGNRHNNITEYITFSRYIRTYPTIIYMFTAGRLIYDFFFIKNKIKSARCTTTIFPLTTAFACFFSSPWKPLHDALVCTFVSITLSMPMGLDSTTLVVVSLFYCLLMLKSGTSAAHFQMTKRPTIITIIIGWQNNLWRTTEELRKYWGQLLVKLNTYICYTYTPRRRDSPDI